MKKPLARALAALALAAFVSAPRPAAADDDDDDDAGPPPTGVAFLVTGSIFTGIGLAGMIAANACAAKTPGSDTSEACLGLSLGLGAGFSAVGIPMLVTGVNRRLKYEDWRSQGAKGSKLAARLLDLHVAPMRGGAMALWQARF